NDALARLQRLIRDIPNFPKPGILFRDITPLLADPPGLALAVELLANPFRGKNIDLVVGAESRGFIFATAGTMKACCDMVKQLGGNLAGIAVLIELAGLRGRDKLIPTPVHSVLRYE